MLRLGCWMRWVLCAAVIMTVRSGAAIACRCIEPGPHQAYKAAASVVYAKVLSEKGEKDGTDISYVLEVAESWKLPVESQITIHTGTTCAFEAKVGERYVFFLKRNAQNSYETATCMGNRPEAKSSALLKFLRAQKQRR